MRRWLTACRLCLVWSLTLWLGGFTFYSVVVIPELERQLGSAFDAGLVTQKVTDILNLIGLGTIIVGSIGVVAERRWGEGLRAGSRLAIVLLAVSTACLAGLMLLHRVMDRRLDAESLEGFYTLHGIYLWISTVQWLANLGLMACWAEVRGGRDSTARGQESSSLSGRNTA